MSREVVMYRTAGIQQEKPGDGDIDLDGLVVVLDQAGRYSSVVVVSWRAKKLGASHHLLN